MQNHLLSSHPQLFTTAHFNTRGKHAEYNLPLGRSLSRRMYISLKANNSELKIRHSCLSSRRFLLNRYRGLSDNRETGCMYVKSASAESLNYEQYMPGEDGGGEHSISHDISSLEESFWSHSESFRNRYLNLLKLGSVLNNAAKS